MPCTKTKALYSGISQKWPPWGPRLKPRGDHCREIKTKVNVYMVCPPGKKLGCWGDLSR